MKNFFKRIYGLTFAMAMALNANAQQVSKQTHGASLKLADNSLVEINFVRPDIVRVTVRPTTQAQPMNTGVVVATPTNTKIKTTQQGEKLRMQSDSLVVTMDTRTGSIRYEDRHGRLLMAEDNLQPHPSTLKVTEQIVYDESTRRTEKTVDGERERMDILRRDTIGSTWQYKLQFTPQSGEALYGLGSHMEDYMNLRGHRMYLCQHNLKEFVPVVNSTAGYGLLIDAGSEMIFDATGQTTFIEVEATPVLDYYFMKGTCMDQTVSAYRWLTGQVPMMPRWLFGYTQSKERYYSQDDLVGTLRQFRQRHIPIDLIVQDWNYWKDGSWGTMSMEPKRYPDKKKMADDVHQMHAKLMISIWPNMSNSPQEQDFKQRGYLFEGSNIYDAFRPEVRDLYWDYANNEFFKNGFDAWWCDSSEPVDGDWKNLGPNYTADSHKERWEHASKALSEVLGHERSQLYSLYHAQGIYEHQRAVTSEKRVVNLTRSCYAGQQRYSTIVWNGDTYASWKQFKQMIPAGLNYMATGCPYWSVDAGCFFTKKGWAWFYNGDYQQGVADPTYREFYVRMLQYATFLPVMRSHGTDTPREPWQFGQEGTPYYDAILDCIRLRYSLLPYSYSLAAQITQHDYTLTRALAFDFSHDAKVLDLKDEFLYGPSLLVAPITDPTADYQGSVTRQVYLPQLPNQGVWYDFRSGKAHPSGQSISTTSALNEMPIFVRQGSIIPMADPVEWSEQLDQVPWTIHVYTGQDATFTLYEDAGDGYAYEQGEQATIDLLWNDKKQTLTIGARQGQYNQAPNRTFRIVIDGKQLTTVEYQGKKLKIKNN